MKVIIGRRSRTPGRPPTTGVFDAPAYSVNLVKYSGKSIIHVSKHLLHMHTVYTNKRKEALRLPPTWETGGSSHTLSR